ncbi:FHA domain-containing protein [Pandoraea commovens]|uniref:YscD cytoplasmic domain-containing protein n=1 Tax=Pandoraea commovens TaxID=2508289 RepID=A0A5E4W968_9BURK|nr:FHA domain-containing protein [Pandoraea commovens]VVE20086.1 hypothetical protein PCO31010_03114 [Pandoraea commovens]
MFRNKTDQTEDVEFRVLTGSQSGAALKLNCTPHVVGSGNDADIFLSGHGIAPKHLSVCAMPEGFRIDILDTEAGPITLSRAAELSLVPLGTAVSLGNVVFTVARSGTAWPTATEMPSVRPTEAVARTKKRPQHWLSASLISLCGGSVAIAILIGLSQHSIATPTAKSPSQTVILKANEIRGALGRLGLSSSVQVNTDGATPVLVGYAPNQRTLENAMAVLTGEHGTIDSQVVAIDNLTARAKQYLASNGHKYKIVFDRNGVATLGGLTMTRSSAESAAKDLRDNVKGVSQVKTPFATEEQILNWLGTWEKQATDGPRSHANLAETADGNWEITGAFTPQQRLSLIQSLRNRASAINVVATISVHSTAQPKALAPKPVPVLAVSRGPLPYVLLKDGERLFINGVVNGQRLVSIEDAGPVFSPLGS